MLTTDQQARLSKNRDQFIANLARNVGDVVEMKSGGVKLTDELRNELLKKSMSGEHVELELTVDAYQQERGKFNANFVRVHEPDAQSLADTSKNRPFMKDHAQDDMTSKAGVITNGELEQKGVGSFNIRQTVILRAPWAVQMALHKLMDSVSISFRSRTRKVMCSACETQVFSGNCWHYPGQKLKAIIIDGKKMFVGARDGDVTCEWVYHDVECVECSCVPVPAVRSARVGDIRAALSENGVEFDFDLTDLSNNELPPQPENQNMKTEAEIAALEAKCTRQEKILNLSADERSYFARLALEQQDAFLSKSRKDRQDDMTPVYTSELTGAKFYASDDQRTIDQAKQSDQTVTEMRKQLAEAKVATLHTRANTELAHLSGTTEVRAAILSSIENIADKDTREAALKAIKDYDSKASVSFTRQGGGTARPAVQVDAEEQIQKLADKYEEENDVTPEVAYNAIMETAEGQKLYAQIEAAKKTAPKTN
jgi:hypothetical protein